MQLIASTISQLLLAIAVPYFLASFVMGVRVLRRNGGLGAHEHAEDAVVAEPSAPYHLYFLVPCLNEGVVIGATVSRLLTDSADCRVFVIDDDSDDDTA